MHFVASCSQSRGNFSDDEYLLGRQYAAAPYVDRRSDHVTETAVTGCARALGTLCCSVASFVAVVIWALTLGCDAINISSVSTRRVLGVLITPDLSLDHHIDAAECQTLLPAQTVTPSSTHARRWLRRNTRAWFRHLQSYWLCNSLLAKLLIHHRRRRPTSGSESRMQVHVSSPTPAVAELCEQADDKLFRALRYNPIHPLHRLLPPKRSKPYLTRGRVHNYVLPSKTTTLDECNFMCRLLYKDCF